MKKGFTLIELLAVIVILAIIALIATPIILNIIKSSKEEAVLRSAENYLDAVTQAVARENLNNEFNPSTCDVTSEGNLECSGHELKVEIDGEKPSGNFVEFNNGKIVDYELVFEGGTVTPDGIKGLQTNTSNDVASGYISSVENLISNGKIQTTSEEIECDVTNESNVSYIKCGSQDKVQVDISGTLPVGVIILKDDKAIRYNLMFGEESVIVHEDTIDEWDGTSVSTGLSGCGTEDSPFLIQSAADLMYMRDQVNAGGTITLLDTTCGTDSVTAANSASYKQTVNISLNSDSENYLSWDTTAPKNSWTPIGTYENQFVGSYNGGVHYISGLYALEDWNPFIYHSANIKLRNLEINNSYLTSSSYIYAIWGGEVVIENCGSNSYISGTVLGGFISIVSASSNITLNNLAFNGKMVGSSETGGIIGMIGSNAAGVLNVSNILVDANINSSSRVGGFGGSLYVGSLTISNFVNKSDKINGEYYMSGGLIAHLVLGSGTLSNIKNYADVSATGESGGLIGHAYPLGDSFLLTITNSINKGNVTATNSGDWVGGIIGTSSDGCKVQIENTYNEGNITGDYYVGGLVGYSGVLSISNSYNLGIVNGTSGDIGGIVGYVYNNLEAKEVYNKANINVIGDGYYVGGIAGMANSSQINNSYNTGDITIESNINMFLGGIVGGSNSSTMTNVHNTGTIKYTGTGKSVIGGLFNTVNTFTNNSYLSSTAPVGVANYTTDDSGNIVYTESDGIIKVSSKGDMPSVLSVVNGDSKFKEDTNNINNGYPILSWQ